METPFKIMVVDDEQKICDNVVKILQKDHYQVITAASAEEALDKMARDSFSLLISDIVMPGKNGLELLKLVKAQWPLTKAIIMTAYSSTDTALKAIRLGALDYIPKPFTPQELRRTVRAALKDLLAEAPTTTRERKAIDVIDIDIPFERDEVARYTGEAYVDMLGPSDMPVVEVKPRLDICQVGGEPCDIFDKLGVTCKAGVKSGECPRQKAARKKAAANKPARDVSSLIGIDQPFSYEEVLSVTGPEYIHNLHHDGVSLPYYADLKARVAPMLSGGPARLSFEASPETILVIDDEVAVNHNIRRILVKKGYGVDQAFSKEEALAKLDTRPYPLILLDLKIPGVQDLELLDAVYRKQPESRVIVITGYASIETAVQAARKGVVDYLPKPFTPEELRLSAETALRLAA